MVNKVRHTELGDIPVDWKIQTFEETFRMLSNNTLSRDNLNNRGGVVRNIHYGDILTVFPEVLIRSEIIKPFPISTLVYFLRIIAITSVPPLEAPILNKIA